MANRHHVVIVGGGFGGLYAAQFLRRAPVDVTLIDRRNFHLFQPLLYQVATGGLSPANIAAPLRYVLRKQKNARVLLGEVTTFDADRRRVHLAGGRDVPYDTLIVAAGAGHNYFGNPQWQAHAPGLKTVEEATDIRRRVLCAFEEAEREPDPERVRALLTFVVIGAGPTGVELAGALAELSRHSLRHDFRHIDPTAARVILLDAADRVLPAFPPDLSAKARVALERLGVTVRTGVRVADIGPDSVAVSTGNRTETIPTRTTLWAAGVQASPLGRALADATGAPTDRTGRVTVGPDLALSSHPEICVIGDLAHCVDADGRPLPGVAPVAMQQGKYVAKLIRARLKGQTRPPFRYRDRGTMATIGRSAAVADLGWIRFAGFPAWLAWLFVHLIYLIEFQNRILVLIQWAWNYLTWNRGARLIVGVDPPKVDAPR